MALVIGKTALGSRYLITDTYYDLYAGRYVVHHGLPHSNVFTAVSHGAAWADQQWLAQIMFYGAWSAGGYQAVALLSVALVASGFAILALTMQHRGVPPVRAFAWTTGAFLVCVSNTAIRVQNVAYLFLALVIWLILDDAACPRPRARTWLALPVLAVWANMHGSVVLGVVLVAGYAGYRAVSLAARGQWRHGLAYGGLGCGATGAAFCTPYGTAIVAYYHSTVGNPLFGQYVTEWAAPNLASSLDWAFFGFTAVTLVAAGAAWGRGVRPDPVLGGLAATLLALAATGARFEAWFAFGGSLLASDMLARASGGRAPEFGRGFRRAVAGLLATAALAGVATLALTPGRYFEKGIPRRAIAAAGAIAAANPGARILADQQTSTALLWLYPSATGRVAVDVRYEDYSAAELRKYISFFSVTGPRWQAMAQGYNVVAATRQLPGFVAALRGLPGWRVVYQDRSAVVAVREAPG